ncbi:MAG: hypothetical protein ACHQ06_07350, partial [Candidatus Dormibacteria bacterium]
MAIGLGPAPLGSSDVLGAQGILFLVVHDPRLKELLCDESRDEGGQDDDRDQLRVLRCVDQMVVQAKQSGDRAEREP